LDLALPETVNTRELYMSLSIEIRHVDRIVILELAGRLSVLESGLKKTAVELIDRGERNFIVNLANVAYLDNFGLGQLCWLYTAVRNRGGDMKLLKPTERIKELLRITKLETVFETFEKEADAIRSSAVFTTSLSA
jgi:anti-sigma B factor antagonist